MHPFLLLLTLWWPVTGQAQTQPAATSPVVPSLLVNQTVLNYTQLGINPAAINGTAQFSLIAIEIFSLYIPQTIRPGLGVAIQSAAASANITGNINSIVTSALLAETPPGFLTAVPSQYQPNIARVEAALRSIRAGRNSVSIKSLNASLQTVNSSILISTTDSRGSTIVTLLPATVVNGTKVAVTPTAEVFFTNNTVFGNETTPTTTSSKNVGFAVPGSHVSFAAAGMIGIVGIIVAL